MVRLRSKPCPYDGRMAAADGEGRKRALARWCTDHLVATGRHASSSAGECGVKDQVSRTRPGLLDSSSRKFVEPASQEDGAWTLPSGRRTWRSPTRCGPPTKRS